MALGTATAIQQEAADLDPVWVIDVRATGGFTGVVLLQERQRIAISNAALSELASVLTELRAAQGSQIPGQLQLFDPDDY